MAKVTNKPLELVSSSLTRRNSFLLPRSFFLLLLPLLFYTFSLLRLMAATLAYPWELDQGEGHNVWSAWLLWQGRGPYLDLNQYPFYNSNYPPLHFVLMIPLLWLTGPSLFAGRLLADLCLFGLAAAVGAIVWRYSRRNVWATALAVLLVLASPYFYMFGTIATVNVSQVMFGAWGLYCLGRALDRIEDDGTVEATAQVNWRWLVAGLALLLAAIYTKQQAIDVVAAGFVFLLWRRPRLAILTGLAFGATGGLLFGLIDWLTSHQFYVNLIDVNINQFIRRQLFEQGLAYGLTHAPMLALAAFYALTTLFSKARLSLWLIYLVATGLGSLTVGKFGAAETYFYSSIAAVAICTGLATSRILDFRLWILDYKSVFYRTMKTQPSSKTSITISPDKEVAKNSSNPKWQFLILALLLIVQNVLFYHTPETPHPWKDFIKGHSGNYVAFGGLPTEQQRLAGQRLADYIKAAPPPVLAEEASFAMFNGYEVISNPSNIMVYNQAKLWKGQALEAMVKERCFSLILLHGHFLPDFIQAQMQLNYRKTATENLNNGGDYVLWERLTPPISPVCNK